MKPTRNLLLLVLLFPALAFAELKEEPLITDRPDTAESSKVVGKYRLQLETSFAFGHNDDNATITRTYNFPTLVRFGLLPWLELRAESALDPSDFTDIAFGFKAHALDNEGWTPSMGVLLHWTSDTSEPLLKWLNDWKLPADFALGTNVGFDVPARNFLYAGTVGHPVIFISDRLNTFVEVQGVVPVESTDSDAHTFDTGLTFLVTPDIQLDTFVQIGLVEAATDVTAGIGFSWRAL